MNATEVQVAAISNIPAGNLQFVLSDVVAMAEDAKGRVESAEQLAGEAQFQATNAANAAAQAQGNVEALNDGNNYATALAEYCRFHIAQIAQISGVDYVLPQFDGSARAAVAQSSEDA